MTISRERGAEFFGVISKNVTEGANPTLPSRSAAGSCVGITHVTQRFQRIGCHRSQSLDPSSSTAASNSAIVLNLFFLPLTPPTAYEFPK